MSGTVGTSAAGSKLLLGQEASGFGFCGIIDGINGSQKEPKGPLSKGLGGGAFVRARGVLAVALVEVGWPGPASRCLRALIVLAEFRRCATVETQRVATERKPGS